MKALTAASMTVVLALAACATAGQHPTSMDLDFARYDGFHRSFGGIAHCLRFRNYRCRSFKPGTDTYRCSYEEWSEHEPWPAKTAVIAKRDDRWIWVSGDFPSCSVTFLQ